MPFALRLALSALGGLAFALGQVPWSLWPLALLGLAAILHLITTSETPLRAAAMAFAGGATQFALALSWIIEPFLIEPEIYGWMAPFALVLMAAGGGAFWALPVWAIARVRRGLPGVILALTLSDLARGYVLSGFPWALLGHIWIDTPVVQLVALVGQTGLSLLTLTLVALGVAGSRQRILLVPAVLAIALPWGFGLWRLSLPEPAPTGLTLRLVQPDAAQEGKWDPDLARQHFNALLAATKAEPKVDLVIWPETSLPYLIENSPEVPAIIAAAARGGPVMLGLQRVADQRGWNSLLVQNGAGEVLARYDKHHLVPFGEYIPFGDLAYDWFGLTAFAAQTGKAYSAGPGPQVLDLGALGMVLPLICYEAVFPQDLRTKDRAQWIVQITNDAWFGTRSGPFQHASLARLRAIEQGLPLARVANTGMTQMINARGQVTAALPFGVQAHLDVALPGPMDPPLYARWAEWPLLVLLAGLGLGVLRRPVPSSA
jgi:apolipoprotein N-acyltransferase